jgi:TonB-linked SusC/RagA family outer membrane protein
MKPNLLSSKVSFWKTCILLVLFSTGFHSAHSQIKGTVYDENNDPLIGVSVAEKGTTNGTQTNIDGNYSIKAVGTATLTYSFVGYISKDIVVGNQSIIDITLAIDDKLLNEVVVVGYGSQLKREVTGAVQTINYEDLKDLPVSQIGQKLQGQVAGVQINQTTGKPGQGMNIRIRGQLSVSAGSTPLYVIDGFPITGDIANLNPDEIQDITILKDAASTSLYGSRAANGVVLVTTKKGTKMGTNVSLNAFTGMQTVPVKGRIEMMDAVEFAQFKKEYYEDQGSAVPVEFQNPSQYEGKNNDWYGALLRNAPLQSYTLNVSSNKGNSRTSIVAGVYNQKGVVLNNKYQRYSLRANSEFDVGKDVKLGFNLAPQYVYDNTPRTDGTRGQGILFNALHTWPVMPIYDDNGELTLFNKFPGSTGNIFAYPNYVRSAEELVNETTQLTLLSNAYVSYEPIKGLVVKSSFNVELGRSKYFYFNPSTATYRINRPIPTTAESIRENSESISWLNENLVTYSKSIKDHNFEILGGFTNQTFSREFTRIQGDTYADDRVPTVQGAINLNRNGSINDLQEWSLTSLLSRLTYNYKGKYLFTAAVRRDGSSRFGANNRWGTFPSVSAGWVMSDEDFLSKYNNLSFAKVRASYGIIGNNNIGNYTSYALVDNTVNAVFGSNVVAGARVTSLANPNLGWETTRQFDIGLDLGFFNDRIQFVYDYYTKNTTNLLYSVQVAQESGFSNFNDNIGEIKFWGHEFSLNTKNTRGAFRWNTNFNISFNRNKVLALAEGIDRVYGSYHITQVGQPFGQFYGHIADGVYLNQADLDNSPQVPGRSTVGSIKLLDINGDGVITRGGDNDDRALMGNPFPDFVFGITNTFNYKDFDLSIVGSGSVGNKLLVRHLFSTANLDGVFNMVKEVAYRFRSVENPGKGFYGTTVGGGNVTGIERDWMNSRFVANASNFMIRNITLGYTIKKSNKVFNTARIYGSIQQALVLTKYWGGPNPETSAQNNGQGDGGNLSPGVDLSNYPVPRTFSLGVNLNF